MAFSLCGFVGTVKDGYSALFVYDIVKNSKANFTFLKHGDNEVIDLVLVYFHSVMVLFGVELRVSELSKVLPYILFS